MANKRRRKRNRKPSKKTNVFVAIIGILCVGIVVAASVLHNKSEETDGTSIITPSVTEGPAPDITVTPTPGTSNPDNVTTTPIPTVTQVPEVTVAPVLSKEEALRLVTDAVANSQYKITQKDAPLSVDGKEYYAFVITKDGVEIEPEIVVLKENATLYYYDKAGVISAFTKFPLDNVEIATPEGEEIGKDEAIAIASKLSKQKLGLEKNLKDYIVEVDEWPTTVQGENTYCLNVFDKTDSGQQLVGVFYVSFDGKHIYKLNEETQEFVLISES